MADLQGWPHYNSEGDDEGGNLEDYLEFNPLVADRYDQYESDNEESSEMRGLPGWQQNILIECGRALLLDHPATNEQRDAILELRIAFSSGLERLLRAYNPTPTMEELEVWEAKVNDLLHGMYIPLVRAMHTLAVPEEYEEGRITPEIRRARVQSVNTLHRAVQSYYTRMDEEVPEDMNSFTRNMLNEIDFMADIVSDLTRRIIKSFHYSFDPLFPTRLDLGDESPTEQSNGQSVMTSRSVAIIEQALKLTAYKIVFEDVLYAEYVDRSSNPTREISPLPEVRDDSGSTSGTGDGGEENQPAQGSTESILDVVPGPRFRLGYDNPNLSTHGWRRSSGKAQHK